MRLRTTPLIGVAAPPGPRESLRTVAAVPFTATISVTVSPVRTSPIGSVASVPGPVKCSCAAPAGTPVSVKRPLGSAVVVRLVPTTLIVLTGVARLEARPLPEGPAVALLETCPVIVAPAVAVGGGGATAGEVGSVGDDPPPHATRLTEATNVRRSLRLRIASLRQTVRPITSNSRSTALARAEPCRTAHSRPGERRETCHQMRLECSSVRRAYTATELHGGQRPPVEGGSWIRAVTGKWSEG